MGALYLGAFPCQTQPSANSCTGSYGLIRSLFLPEEGEQWASIISRNRNHGSRFITQCIRQSTNTELSGVADMVDAYEQSRYRLSLMVAEMTGLKRKAAKSVGLGIIYGMGVNKLAAGGCIRGRSKDILKQFNSKLRFLKQLNSGVQRRLEDRRSSGSIRSLRGASVALTFRSWHLKCIKPCLTTKRSRLTGQQRD